MSSNAPASSPPIIDTDYSPKSIHSSSPLPLPQLPYRNIGPTSETPNFKKFPADSHSIRPSSPIATSDSLRSDLLAVFKAEFEDIEEDDEFEGEEVDLATENIANQTFLEEVLESSSDSDSDDFDSDFEDFDFDSDDSETNNLEGHISEASNSNIPGSFENFNNRSVPSRKTRAQSQNGLLSSCHTNYAREKLVQILNGEVLLPKQRWGIDRILATLTYHRKDKRLHSSYRQFKQFAYYTIFKEADKSSGQLPGVLT